MRAKVWKKKFDTLDEAKGFADGVEFVNDSALTVKSIKLAKGKWAVSIEDTDYTQEYPQKGREH